MNTKLETPPSQALDKDALFDMLREMLTIRAFETRVGELYERAEMPGITHLSIGQEAVAVGFCAHLNRGDSITSTHRGARALFFQGSRFGEDVWRTPGEGKWILPGKRRFHAHRRS